MNNMAYIPLIYIHHNAPNLNIGVKNVRLLLALGGGGDNTQNCDGEIKTERCHTVRLVLSQTLK